MKRMAERLGKYKYLLLLLLVGLALILMPSRSSSSSLYAAEGSATERESRLEAVLSRVEGVGRVSVLCSDEGAAVVCDGADSAATRLAVTEAVTRYTGYGSEKITVLKMKQEAGN